ncbi:hypothetical protein CAMGR0001_2250 [Campylobacter gracilis RM3268]|uniref:Uncharacterized protein n=1 Tax=Campylobacter gracilis RM3268 TaxID=553220 RepID=C8PH62_9BACT|nr:hypothetical protein CAMGR0001_2250 [Campylobacter gracilis RM3268]
MQLQGISISQFRRIPQRADLDFKFSGTNSKPKSRAAQICAII